MEATLKEPSHFPMGTDAYVYVTESYPKLNCCFRPNWLCCL